MTTRTSRRVIMGKVVMMLADRLDNITFHDLHMVNVVEQPYRWRIDQTAHLYPPGGLVGLIVWVIYLAIEQFQHQGHPLILRNPGKAFQAFRRYLRPCPIIQPLTIPTKDNDIGNAPLCSERYIGTDLSFKAIMM